MGYKYFMNNPVGARVGDCAVRAISKALGISWEDAYTELVVAGYQMADMQQMFSLQSQLAQCLKKVSNKAKEIFGFNNYEAVGTLAA